MAVSRAAGSRIPERPFSLPAADLLEALDVDPEQGLAAAEVEKRRAEFGANELPVEAPRSVASILLAQFESLVVGLLIAAAALAFAFGDLAEGIAIVAVIALNALIGFLSEWRATRSMEALRRLGVVQTQVLRDGKRHVIPAAELVPGDIVLREAGDVVSADVRLIEAQSLQVTEAALTGESQPVRKAADAVTAGTPLAERRSMLYRGTMVTRGAGKGVVVATGRATEVGRIAELVASAEAGESPLEKRLDALGARLARIVLLLTGLLAVAGVLAGRDLLLSIEVAVALAVAAIPEGLPVVATIALARGMWRMARRNAIVSRLSAVETLGTTRVIVTDKTGTLTENRMTLTELRLPGRSATLAEACGEAGGADEAIAELLRVGALCSNAELEHPWQDEKAAVGDPTEAALLVAAERCGVSQAACRRQFPELREWPFDADRKLMATLHARDGGHFVAVKGAPEALIGCCDSIRSADGTEQLTEDRRREALSAASELGEQGLRTLALASRAVAEAPDDPFGGLTWLGVVGLEDPARDGVAEAVASCRSAGIRVVMVTGDHVATAREIARDVGILPADDAGGLALEGGDVAAALAGLGEGEVLPALVVARATPEQKLALIEHYQQRGEVVAMTGDGVNDAPALRKSDIGIAMGIRGTPVAKEAAAMVLQDDDFSTIVAAVAHGRAIYANIRKFVVYLLSCNISEILVVTLATLAGAPLPLLPLQILFLNFVTDVFPALALGVGRGAPGLMREAPRPAGEPLVTAGHWRVIAGHGLTLSLSVLASMAAAVLLLGFDADEAVTVSFCTLAFGQLWHVFNVRSRGSSLFRNEVSANRWVWGAIGLCTVLILAAVYLPGLAAVLNLAGPGAAGWGLVAVFSLLPLALGPLVRPLERKSGRGPR